MILVLAFFGSLIPGIILFLWLRGQKDMAPDYRERCGKSLLYGLISVVAVLFVSLIINIILKLLHLQDGDPLLYRFLQTMLVLAFAEELTKFFAMKKAVKGRKNSWFELTVFMTLAGLGFEMAEAIPYAIGNGPITMFVRGITLMHASYGFILGWSVGKSAKTGNKIHGIIGFLACVILHGLYDFSLSEEFLSIDDDLAAVAFALVAVSVVALILLIRFVIKRRNDPKYTEITVR